MAVNVERVHQWTAHSAALYALTNGRADDRVFSGGADRVVAEWQLGAEAPNAFAIRVDSTIYSLVHLSNDQLVIGTANGSLNIIDTKAKKEIRHLQFHEEGMFDLCFSDERERLYAGSADGTMSVWNTSDWSLLWHIPLTQKKIRRIALSPDGRHVAVALGDGDCAVLETQEHRLVYRFQAHEESCNALAFVDENTLLTGGKDAYLKRWDLSDSALCIRSIPAHNFALYDIIVPPHRRWIATGSRDKTIKIWDLELQEKPYRIDRINGGGHINSVNKLHYNAAEDILYSCGDDRSVNAWRIQ